MISFVVPVYRSAESLPELHRRVSAVFGDGEQDLEIVFVEDCGGDDSWSVIQRLAATDPRVRGFRMSRNYGQHNALLCGIREARGETIVTLDDDLQHPPEEIPKLLAKLDEGYDVVYGPPEREQHGLLRDLASQITKLALEGAMGAANARQVSALRVFRTRLREAFAKYRSPTVNIDVLLTWATTSFSAVRVRHEARKYGQSGYTPQAGATCLEYDDRLLHPATAACQPDGFRLCVFWLGDSDLRAGSLAAARQRGARFRLPGFHRSDLLRRAVDGARYYW